MQPCIHCGQDCGKHPVIWEDKSYCCEGCVMVYRILTEKKLGQYYDIMPTPGVRVEAVEIGQRYAYLDHEDIRSSILIFSDGGINKVNFFIPVIHCSSCIWLLENLHSLHPGVLSSFVNFIRKEVSITFRESEISLRQLVELLHSIHYIPDLSFRNQEKDNHQKANRRLLMKIGVAGFAFGNIMLLSFPDYLPGGEKIDRFLTDTFGAITFLLALPVIFFCSSDFFLSAYKSLRKNIINIDFPLSLGILALFLESSYEIFSGGGNGYMDSLAGLLFFMLIGRWYQGKSYQSLSFDRDYKSFFPIAVTRIRDQQEEFIPINELKAGDIILVRNQELIPADSIVIEGQAQIDYSFVTGESIPVSKQQGELVFAGGKQSGAGITLAVQKEVTQSYLTQLWNEDRMAGKKDKALQKVVDRVSHYFTIIIIAVALGSGIYWAFSDAAKAAYVFSSVLIIACPCALALTIPFTIGSVMRVFGRNGFYIKNTDVIEKLKSVDAIVFDKTGTLTHSRTMKAEWVGEELSAEENSGIRSLARNSTHPASVTIVESIEEGRSVEVVEFREIPSLGISGVAAGRRILLGSYRFIAGETLPETGTTTAVYVSIDSHIKGYFRIENHYREGLKELVSELSPFQLHLLTGDNDSEKVNLLKYFRDETPLHFRQSPGDKLEYTMQLKTSGANVLMIGDGLNDAGALLEADVGITIADDVYHFSPACDAILNSGRFRDLGRFIRFTHKAFRVVYISFFLSFLYNVVGLAFAVQGLLSPIIAAILMPISSISIVAFTTISVSILSRTSGLRIRSNS